MRWQLTSAGEMGRGKCLCSRGLDLTASSIMIVIEVYEASEGVFVRNVLCRLKGERVKLCG